MFEIRRKSNNELLSTGLQAWEVEYLITVKKWPVDEIEIIEL